MCIHIAKYIVLYTLCPCATEIFRTRVWHDSFAPRDSFACTCGMTHSRSSSAQVCHDASVYAYGMTHARLETHLRMCVAWLSHAAAAHMCDTTHSCVKHDSFICVAWRSHMSDTTHSYVRYEVWQSVACWLIQRCICICLITSRRKRLWQTWARRCWYIHVSWHHTHTCIPCKHQQNSLTCTRTRIGTFFNFMCDMSPAYVWQDALHKCFLLRNTSCHAFPGARTQEAQWFTYEMRFVTHFTYEMRFVTHFTDEMRFVTHFTDEMRFVTHFT